MASDWLFAAAGIPAAANDWLKNLIHGGDTKTVIPVLVSRNTKLGDWWIYRCGDPHIANDWWIYQCGDPHIANDW